jgi:hypothetical protein
MLEHGKLNRPRWSRVGKGEPWRKENQMGFVGKNRTKEELDYIHAVNEYCRALGQRERDKLKNAQLSNRWLPVFVVWGVLLPILVLLGAVFGF